MNMKRSMKMSRGFMCQSPAATAVCMTGDPRSVVVPRRPDGRTPVDLATLIRNTKYARLGESHDQRFGNSSAAKMRATTASVQDKGSRERKALPKPSSVLPSSDQVFQVVVMRVSLHCQGCAGKVKKHISKMEGVTSYSIDLETKRVTVMGHVSPVGVLESISKVKKAEFWSC